MRIRVINGEATSQGRIWIRSRSRIRSRSDRSSRCDRG